ncbi:MAG: hypothetical protein JEZ02_19685 [Desulfatibacillum sp.]|nr:hypothetical protein [Desulfatibacillum sp.]
MAKKGGIITIKMEKKGCFMRLVKVVTIVLLLAAFVGCGGGGPKIDGSSDQAFKESLEAVRATLEEEQVAEFDKAIMTIAFQNMGAILTNPMTPEAMMTKVKDDLDGKNAKQVIEMAKELKENKKK